MTGRRGLDVDELPTGQWLLLLAITLVLNAGILLAAATGAGRPALAALIVVEVALVATWARRRWTR